MIYFKCDRCSKQFTDNGVRYSQLPESWDAYCLIKVTPEGEEWRHSEHICDHCKNVPKMKLEFEI